MKTIRYGVFETNSSSQHAFISLSCPDFKRLCECSWDKHAIFIYHDGDNYPDPETGKRKDCTWEVLTIEDAYKKYCELVSKNTQYKYILPKNEDDFEDLLDDDKLNGFAEGHFVSYSNLLHNILLPDNVKVDLTFYDSDYITFN